MSEPFPPLHGVDGTARRRETSGGLGVDVPSLATTRRGTPSIESTSDKIARRSKPWTARRYLAKAKRVCIRHTWALPLIISLIVGFLWAIYPYESNPLSACLFLSYPLPRDDPLIPADVRATPNSPIHYGKGGRDFAFVAFYIVVLSFTREFCMQRLLRPLARSYGIRNRDKQVRFMEQGYTAMYFVLFGPFGMWIMWRTPVWYFNTVGMYEGFPHRTSEAVFKAYYLLQASYWAQQAIVLLLRLEKPRKDYYQLVAHHVITVSLIWLSYRFHFTYVGIAVYTTHDISDFFLATSKCLHYVDAPGIDYYFALFMSVWAYTRHYLNWKILKSVLTTFETVGPFELDWETQQYKCWISQYIAFGLLASLQAVNIYWFYLIGKIAIRFIKDKKADDDRSEYGSTEDEEDERGAFVREGRAEEMVEVLEKIEDAPNTPATGTTAVVQGPVGSTKAKKRKGGKK